MLNDLAHTIVMSSNEISNGIYMQNFTEGSGELATSGSGERRGEFAAAKVMERIKIIAKDSATLEYAKTALTKSPVHLIMCTYM